MTKQNYKLGRFIASFILICVMSISSFSQSWEFGGMAGASNYHGDIAYNIVPKETNFSGGAFFRYNFNQYWTMRPTISYLKISGADSNFNEYKLRNLSFRNNIFEVSNIMEFNFQPFSNKAVHNKTAFYAMAGIGVFYSKPEAQLDGEWHDLQKISTENTNYSKIQLSIPFGGGLKHAVNRNFLIGLEVGWRKTFTDYLDDVSTIYPSLNSGAINYEPLVDRSIELSTDGTSLASPGDMRGDPNLKDWYFQTALTISYRFTPIKCPFKVGYFQ